ncbi:outer membrane protein assembly factor BamD [Vibrio sinaloensis]|nr:outer membrane protein assembly factor BamD [Vibrio sinaloensis]
MQIFKRLLERYPTSPYAEDAQKRMLALKKNRLAEYDLATADFFIYVVKHGSQPSIVHKSCKKTYPDTVAARESLQIQLEAYKALGLEDAIKRTQQLIELNPL